MVLKSVKNFEAVKRERVEFFEKATRQIRILFCRRRVDRI